MNTAVAVEIGYEFDVKASARDVFAVLSDVPTSASHYPQVDKLVDLGKGVYRWEMEKIGVGQFTLQTVYTAQYVSNKAKGTVFWTPVKGEGNAQVAGSWKINDNKTSTNIVLKVQVSVDLPIPQMMKMVAAPLLEAEFERLTEIYIDNLIKRFGGEV
jgi:carbon monoxide dehydrogenase subunit G